MERGKTRRSAADLLELQVGFGKTDMLDRFARSDVREIAESLNRHALAPELFRVGKFRRHGKNLIEIVAQGRNHHQIGAA